MWTKDINTDLVTKTHIFNSVEKELKILQQHRNAIRNQIFIITL